MIEINVSLTFWELIGIATIGAFVAAFGSLMGRYTARWLSGDLDRGK